MSRTILITGGSGKFGKSLVPHFLKAGDRVVTTSRAEATVADMQKAYVAYDQNFVALCCDLIKESAARELGAKLQESGIYPDCLVNNARNLEYLQMDDAGNVSRENFTGEFLLDVIVPYELTNELAHQEGSQLRKVVNIGSQYGSSAANLHLYTDPLKQSPLHYGVCKAGLVHLTKELAVRLAPKNIQVNCVAFGGVEGRVDESFKERYAKLCPMGRMLRDDEVVGPVDSLLSDNFSGMTGHVMAVDGGWGIW